MEMPVAGWGKVMNYEQEIAEAAYPAIRLFQVKKNTSLAPLKEVESTGRLAGMLIRYGARVLRIGLFLCPCVVERTECPDRSD